MSANSLLLVGIVLVGIAILSVIDRNRIVIKELICILGAGACFGLVKAQLLNAKTQMDVLLMVVGIFVFGIFFIRIQKLRKLPKE